MMPNERRYLELLRWTDILLSMLMSEIQDIGMRKQADELLRSIEVETRNSTSKAGPTTTPVIEYGTGWAKIHFRRDVTEQDRANLAIALSPAQEAPNPRPAAFLTWAKEMFGPVAALRGERLMRFVEEAIELAHADKMERATLDAIANRVYSRAPGEITKEIGQAQACLEIYAENIGESSDLLAELEWQRVRNIPRAEWERRHKAKQEIGIALADTSAVTRPHHQEGGK